MLLIPMKYAWEWTLLYYSFQGDMTTNGTETQLFCCITKGEHGNTFTGNAAYMLHRFCRILLPIILGYHPQTRCPTFHGVGLLDKRNMFHFVFYIN